MRKLAFTVLGSLLLTSSALADATLVVRVQGATPGGRAPEGTVTLTTGTAPARTFTCHTTSNACTISGVPGGMHSVVFAPDGGAPGASRNVMVPPTGSVTLIVNSPR